MCRGIAEGGRRCPGDSSAARQARRISVRAAGKHREQLAGETERQGDTAADIAPAPPVVTAASLSAAREELAGKFGQMTPQEMERAVSDYGRQVLGWIADDPEIQRLQALCLESSNLNNDKTYVQLYYDPQVAAYFERKRELLGQLRPMGGELLLTTDAGPVSAASRRMISAAANVLPSDWIDASNAYADRSYDRYSPSPIKLRVRESKSRAHYSPAVASRAGATRTPSVRTHIIGKENVDAKVAEFNASPFTSVESVEQDGNTPFMRVTVANYDVVYPGTYDWQQGSVEERDGVLYLGGRRARDWKPAVDSRGAEEERVWRKPLMKVNRPLKRVVTAELTVPKGGDGLNSTAVHELTHRCENVNPRIPSLERAFLQRRVTGPDGETEPLTTIYAGTKERGYKDDFANHYIGKTYASNTYYEVMSMGNEAALTGSLITGGDAGHAARGFNDHLGAGHGIDNDHHAFVIGTLLVA